MNDPARWPRPARSSPAIRPMPALRTCRWGLANNTEQFLCHHLARCRVRLGSSRICVVRTRANGQHVSSDLDPALVGKPYDNYRRCLAQELGGDGLSGGRGSLWRGWQAYLHQRADDAQPASCPLPRASEGCNVSGSCALSRDVEQRLLDARVFDFFLYASM